MQQRWIPVLAVVLAAQLALAAALGLSGDRLTAQKPDTPLVEAELDTADRLVIEGPTTDNRPTDEAAKEAAPVEISKQDATWILRSYYEAPADTAKVQGVLDKLDDLKRGYAVATTAGALKRFKVAEDSFERRVVVGQGDDVLATVYLGSSPGLRKVHARTAEHEAVYAVELPTHTLPHQASEWLDKGLVQPDADALEAIALTWEGDSHLKLVRDSEDADAKSTAMDRWQAEGLAQGEHVSAEQAQALARAISELRVDGVLGTEAQPEWRQAQPLLTLNLKKRDGETVVWTLSKPEEGNTHVLKASTQPWYLELQEWNAKPLLEAAARDELVVAEQPLEAEKPESEGTEASAETDSAGAAFAPEAPTGSDKPEGVE